VELSLCPPLLLKKLVLLPNEEIGQANLYLNNVMSHLLINKVLLIERLFKLCEFGVELFEIFYFVFLDKLADVVPEVFDLLGDPHHQHFASADQFELIIFVLAFLPVFVNHTFAHKWLQPLSSRDEIHRN
jgi:hypothetical protein